MKVVTDKWEGQEPSGLEEEPSSSSPHHRDSQSILVPLPLVHEHLLPLHPLTCLSLGTHTPVRPPGPFLLPLTYALSLSFLNTGWITTASESGPAGVMLPTDQGVTAGQPKLSPLSLRAFADTVLSAQMSLPCS